MQITKQGPPTDDGGFDEDTWKGMPQTTKLLLADVVDVESTTNDVTVEPCVICLNEYKRGEILCWSQNSSCSHCFHRDCMGEWLLRHEDCPCCRTNYLSLDGDEPTTTTTTPAAPTTDVASPEETYAYLRGMHLFHLLSQLQSLVETRPNTTIRLEGVELADGRRGSLEIQRANAASLEVNGRGLNVRVAADDDIRLELPAPSSQLPDSDNGSTVDLESQ
jgi:hypothetical protein